MNSHTINGFLIVKSVDEYDYDSTQPVLQLPMYQYLTSFKSKTKASRS